MCMRKSVIYFVPVRINTGRVEQNKTLVIVFLQERMRNRQICTYQDTLECPKWKK